MQLHEFLKKHQGDLSKYRIAKETGINESMVGKIFNGTHTPSATKFFKIVKALKIPPETITDFAREFIKLH